jgi:hypothetical protein
MTKRPLPKKYPVTLVASLIIALMAALYMVLPAIDQNTDQEFCTYIAEGANWVSQGQPCKLNSLLVVKDLGRFTVFFASMIILFLMPLVIGLDAALNLLKRQVKKG